MISFWTLLLFLWAIFVVVIGIEQYRERKWKKRLEDNTDCIIEYVNGRFMLIDKDK